MIDDFGVLILPVRHIQVHDPPGRAGDVGDFTEESRGAPTQGHEGNTQLVELTQVGVGSQFGIEHQLMRIVALLLLPKLGKAHDLVGLLSFQQISARVANHLAVAGLSQKDQDRLLTAAALGKIVAFDKIIVPKEGDRMEIQIEAFGFKQRIAGQGFEPGGAEALQHLGPEAIRIGGQVGGFGSDVQTGKECQTRIKDQVHDMALALEAAKFEGQGGQDRLQGRDHFGARKPCRIDQRSQIGLDQPRQQEKETTELGVNTPGSQGELPAVGDGGRFRLGVLGTLVVGTPGQPTEAFGAQDLPDGGVGKGGTLFFENPFNVVDRVILFAQGDDELAGGILFGLRLGARSELAEEVGLGLAEVVAKNAEGAWGIAEVFGDQRGREAFDEVGAKGLVLALSGGSGFEEKFCFFS